MLLFPSFEFFDFVMRYDELIQLLNSFPTGKFTTELSKPHKGSIEFVFKSLADICDGDETRMELLRAKQSQQILNLPKLRIERL